MIPAVWWESPLNRQLWLRGRARVMFLEGRWLDSPGLHVEVFKILNHKLLLMCWSAPCVATTAINVCMYVWTVNCLNALKCKHFNWSFALIAAHNCIISACTEVHWPLMQITEDVWFSCLGSLLSLMTECLFFSHEKDYTGTKALRGLWYHQSQL